MYVSYDRAAIGLRSCGAPGRKRSANSDHEVQIKKYKNNLHYFKIEAGVTVRILFISMLY